MTKAEWIAYQSRCLYSWLRQPFIIANYIVHMAWRNFKRGK